MKLVFTAAVAATFAATPVLAQVAEVAPIVAQPAGPKQAELPANTELLVRMNDELSSKTANEGDTFSLTVVHNVMLNNHVVIPAGARAVGEVTWRTGKGAFGKSGKMQIEMRYVEVGGQRLPIEGSFRQEGEGNTAATVVGVVAVGVFAGFITGKTAVIPRGRELAVRTREALPVAFGAPQPVAFVPAQPVAVSAPQPIAAIAPVYQTASLSDTGSRQQGESCGAYARRLAPGNMGAIGIIESRCEAAE